MNPWQKVARSVTDSNTTPQFFDFVDHFLGRLEKSCPEGVSAGEALNSVYKEAREEGVDPTILALILRERKMAAALDQLLGYPEECLMGS
ncbi:MAG: hypothetical protein HQL52_01160 [Magnetococcales bacterium]|nr:hypothetical protein [Magnetococcales bacterium]